MAIIDRDADVATVIVLMTIDPADQQALVALAEAAQPIFARQPGFVAAALHRSGDGTRVVQYLQWRSLADSQACMESPDWQGREGADFMGFLQAGKATMEVHDYTVVATA